MTVPATTRRAGPFNGNGVTTSFPFTFKVFAAADIQFVTADADGLETLRVLGSDYSVTLNPDQDASPGGSVTYPISGTPLASGHTAAISGAVEYTQELDLPGGGSFSPTALENALDRTTMQIQQLAEEVGRSLTLPVTAASADSELPVPEAGKVIAWNSTATALVNVDSSDLASVVVAGSAYTDIFDGTGAQTAFSLTADPGGANTLTVSISGVVQTNGVDFTVSGTTLTFTSAPPAGTGNVMARYVAAVPVGTGNAQDIVFEPSGAGAVDRTAQAKMRERISVSDFLSAAELAAVQAGASALDVSVAVRRAVAAGAGRDVWFDAPGTYYMATTDSGAYITLSATGTRLRLEKNAKIRFADAAVYGINITGQLCGVEDGLLWGTNTTAPTITAIVRVAGNNSDVIGCNIAYGVIGTDIAGTYIIKHERNSYSNCDIFLKTSGSCADLESKGNTYGTSSIGTAANVVVSGSGGIDMHDYWESMDQAKLALQCVTGAQRVVVRGKIFDSGGVEVQNSVYLRLDVEMMDSYTGTIGVDVKSGATVDATGSYLSGPGITSGVEAFNVDGNLVMGSGFITKWQIGGDINGNASIGDVTVAQCTTGWDVFGSSLGKIGPCFYSGVTTPIVRATATLLSLLDAFTGSATFDPISLADGAGETTTITVTGARLGDHCDVSFSNDLQGVLMTSWVTNDTVNVRFQNETGGTIDLASGTLRARVSNKVI